MRGDPIQVRLAVVTGGHAFDVPNFHRLFRRLAGIDAYVQPMDDFASSSQETRDAYDGIVFYHMLHGTPVDTGQPRHSDKSLQALERLKETGQGLVVMHHALLAYEQWPTWREVSGINPVLRGYHHDQRVKVRVLNREHPITAGLADFEVKDETYEVDEPDEDNEILLATDHPQSVKALAWTRSFGSSKVFAIALGHDDQGWRNPQFEVVLRRGILWTVTKGI